MDLIKELKDHGYDIEMQGDKIVVSGRRKGKESGFSSNVKEIPSNIIFNIVGMLYIINESLTIGTGVEFNNKGVVNLQSLEYIPEGVKFGNSTGVYIKNLKRIHPTVRFNNSGDVFSDSLFGDDFPSLQSGYFSFGSDIRRIGNRVLLNSMINQGIFYG